VTTADSSNQVLSSTSEAGYKYNTYDDPSVVNLITVPSAFNSYPDERVERANGQVILMRSFLESPLSKLTASLNPLK